MRFLLRTNELVFAELLLSVIYLSLLGVRIFDTYTQYNNGLFWYIFFICLDIEIWFQTLMSENSHIYEYMIKMYLAIRVVYLLLFPFNFIKNIKYILQVSQCQNPTFFCICSNQQKAFWQQVQGSRIFDYMVKISMLLFLALLFTFLYYNYDIKINNVLMASCDKFCSKGLTNLCMYHFVLTITLWSTY